MTAFCIWQYTDHVKFGNIQCFQHTDRARFGKIMTVQRECLSIVDLCGHCERGEGRGSWKGVVLHVSSLNKDKKDHVHGSVADSLVTPSLRILHQRRHPLRPYRAPLAPHMPRETVRVSNTDRNGESDGGKSNGELAPGMSSGWHRRAPWGSRNTPQDDSSTGCLEEGSLGSLQDDSQCCCQSQHCR